MGFDRVDGDVEGLTYLPVRIVAVEKTQHVELAFGKHCGERGLCSPTLAQLMLLALEQIREYAGVRVSLQNVPRLPEKRPGPGPIAACCPDSRERQQPEERGPRVYLLRPARRKTKAPDAAKPPRTRPLGSTIATMDSRPAALPGS